MAWPLEAFWCHRITLADPAESELQMWEHFSEQCPCVYKATLQVGDKVRVVGREGLGMTC